MIELRQITKIYAHPLRRGLKVPVLSNINLEINRGELTTIFGPSGSGKTTLISILAGLVQPTAGDVLHNSKSVLDDKGRFIRPYVRGISVVTQFPEDTILFGISVRENLEYYHRIRSATRGSQLRERIRSQLQLAGIEELSDEMPAVLSGGELQRLALLCATSGEPEVLVCDEPTAKLDRENRDLVKSILEKEAEDGKYVVSVTHDREFLRGTKSHELIGGELR